MEQHGWCAYMSIKLKLCYIYFSLSSYLCIYLLGIHLIPQPRGRRAIMPRKDENERQKEKFEEKMDGAKGEIFHLNSSLHRGVGTHHAMKRATIKEKQSLRKRRKTENFPLYTL